MRIDQHNKKPKSKQHPYRVESAHAGATDRRISLEEKLLTTNLASLDDNDVLRLLFHIAKIPPKAVNALVDDLLKKYHNIGKIISLSTTQLFSLSESVQILLKVIKSIVTRAAKEQIVNKTILNNTDALLRYIRINIGHKDTECLNIIFLNHKNILITEEIIEYGTVDSVALYPREILKQAIVHNASAVVLAHNHPSGNTTPSAIDIKLTKQIKVALASLSITLIDHIIISDSEHYSFKRHHLI